MIRPMLASLVDAPLVDSQLVYEPKYDGIRAIAEVPSSGGHVRLWSRLGNEKTGQFPEIVRALEQLARRLRTPVVLDGEITALDGSGQPAGFQQLQGRIHDTRGREPVVSSAFIVFDLLKQGRTDLRDRPLTARRSALERLLAPAASSAIRLSEQIRGDGRALYERALASGWEGLIAKHADSTYKSGARTPDWRKLKIVQEQEFVIGGWTEPRQTRAHFGALLLGLHEAGPDGRVAAPLTYVGHTGTGFTEKELARLMKLLRPLATKECPFYPPPRTNERAHWTKPELVAQVKFTEWTADRKLRHPVYLGLRDDKRPEDVVRESQTRLHRASTVRLRAAAPSATSAVSIDDLIGQLDELEWSGRDGTLRLPQGQLAVTNLRKVFWPARKLTKGDLFRHYVRVSPFILPALADRPLVMKRFPNGIGGHPFYQHRVEKVPAGVRVQVVAVAESRPHLIGGDLATLLYSAQLAAISQDPWFSRVEQPQFADVAAIDLDPSDAVPFARVLDVARFLREELDRLGAPSFPKTSGASGMHIYIPLPPATPYEAGLILCQIVATVVAAKHPKVATVERAVRARGARVYVDYMQNALGKTLASVYSARANEFAGVSAPLTWKEIDAGVRPEDFTLETMPARLKDVGDLWKGIREVVPVDLRQVTGYAGRVQRAATKKSRPARRGPS
jgi:bifunctional non-homologous end joining protein LigD